MKYTATYWDASLHDPERLAIDVLRDGRAAGGDRARAANYAAAVGRRRTAGSWCATPRPGEEVPFAASVVINASGPWTDLTNLALGDPTRYMGGTKGSHIVLDHPELLAATGGRELFFENNDGRIVLIYPLKGRVLVGTTDLEHDMADPIVCTEAEVDYFIDLDRAGAARHRGRPLADRLPLRRACGPLPGHGDVAPGLRLARLPHRGRSRLAGGDATVLSLVGGKWTTFRASAEHLADRALELLARPRRRSTKGVAIGGGRGFPTTSARDGSGSTGTPHGLPAGRVATLLDRYGTVADRRDRRDRRRRRGRRALAHAARRTAPPSCATSRGTEDVVHLDDLLMRRTSLAFTGAVTEAAAAEIAAAIAPVAGVGCRRASRPRRARGSRACTPPTRPGPGRPRRAIA